MNSREWFSVTAPLKMERCTEHGAETPTARLPTRDGRGQSRVGLWGGAGPSCRGRGSVLWTPPHCLAVPVGLLLWAPACSARPQWDMWPPRVCPTTVCQGQEGCPAHGHLRPQERALSCRRCWEQEGHSMCRGSGCAAAVPGAPAAGRNGGPQLGTEVSLQWGTAGSRVGFPPGCVCSRSSGRAVHTDGHCWWPGQQLWRGAGL